MSGMRSSDVQTMADPGCLADWGCLTASFVDVTGDLFLDLTVGVDGRSMVCRLRSCWLEGFAVGTVHLRMEPLDTVRLVATVGLDGVDTFGNERAFDVSFDIRWENVQERDVVSATGSASLVERSNHDLTRLQTVASARTGLGAGLRPLRPRPHSDSVVACQAL